MRFATVLLPILLICSLAGEGDARAKNSLVVKWIKLSQHAKFNNSANPRNYQRWHQRSPKGEALTLWLAHPTRNRATQVFIKLPQASNKGQARAQKKLAQRFARAKDKPAKLDKLLTSLNKRGLLFFSGNGVTMQPMGKVWNSNLHNVVRTPSAFDHHDDIGVYKWRIVPLQPARK